MPEPPLPSGGPTRQAADRSFGSVGTAANDHDLRRPSAAAPRTRVHWRDIEWVGFEEKPAPPPRVALLSTDPAPLPALAVTPLPSPRPAVAPAPVPAVLLAVDEEPEEWAAAEEPEECAAASIQVADDGPAYQGFEDSLELGALAEEDPEPPPERNLAAYRHGSFRSRSRAWRMTAAAAASIAIIALSAYVGGEKIAGLAGATTPPAATEQDDEPGPANEVVLAAVSSVVAPQAGPQRIAAPDQERSPPADPVERAAYFLERARGGDALAQYNLAVLYARGEGLVQDLVTAAGWFREAAINGNAAAQFNLGVLYERGLGVAQDIGEAVGWYRRAADRDYPAAQYNLALAYAEGRGTPRNPIAAAGWYHRAAQQGIVPAMINFAILYEKGEGVEKSPADAYAWYCAAADRGDPAAQKRASELYRLFKEADKRQAEETAKTIAASIRDPASDPAAPPRLTRQVIPASVIGAAQPRR